AVPGAGRAPAAARRRAGGGGGGGAPQKRPSRTPSGLPAPKRAATAYAFFALERRPALLERRPELAGRPVEQQRLLIEEWRALGDGGQAPYVGLEAQDLSRYSAELEALRARALAKQQEAVVEGGC
ncbi:unnamed protein product, partial [Prorocentrum cordatum]